MHVDILSYQNRIEHLFNKNGGITDIEIQSNWSKYICVLVSGYIEESLRILFFEYAKNNSNPKIRRYVDSHIRRITNCKNSKIIEVLDYFSTDWVNDYKSKIARRETVTNQIGDAIDSVIANRHQIAHGKNIGLSHAIIRKYYNDVKIAIDVLNTVIN